jgi:hypothetical protein
VVRDVGVVGVRVVEPQGQCIDVIRVPKILGIRIGVAVFPLLNQLPLVIVVILLSRTEQVPDYFCRPILHLKTENQV